ncbi:hypothetical protein [Maribacter arenosus]|uniref:Uncharacterized protein n=1 Tax=Maribacter arenosus TaxID=1854708 RepID=A0ABR7V767_9FLAO|nr:hypothetical protein [Maribacter arenosus]MBD0849544.1 hypothetical protein [Maribacter arenosus]
MRLNSNNVFERKTMNFLSPQIEALSKKKIKEEAPLAKRVNSCGIFQDYGSGYSNPKQNGKTSDSNELD